MKIRAARSAFFLLFPLPLLACGARSASTAAEDRSIITQAQIRERNFVTAFDAVQTLRPNWLVTSGPDSFRNPSQIQVYLDNSRLGGVSQLRSINSHNIVYIRFINGIDATTRWGLDHGAGVIFVSTRDTGG